MKHLLARPRTLLGPLSAMALAVMAVCALAAPASAGQPVSVPAPEPVPLCVDAEGNITHCPIPPEPCRFDSLEGFPTDCPEPVPCVGPPGSFVLCPDLGPGVPIDVPKPLPPIDPAPAPVKLPFGVLAVQDFSAFVNAQPGPDAKRNLIVTGTVVVSSPAVSVRLRETNPQGINPRILLLDAVVQRLPRIVPQIVRKVEVRFESTNFVDIDEVNIPALGLRLPVSIVR
jgi:hypothetical protein